MRAAAYNLGVLQALEDNGLLRQASDSGGFLSAVGGGAYIVGAFAIVDHSTPPSDHQAPFRPNSPEEQYLRNHTDYLAPGPLGKFRLVFTLVLGLLINLGLIALALYVIGHPIGWIYHYTIPVFTSPPHCVPDKASTCIAHLSLSRPLVWTVIGFILLGAGFFVLNLFVGFRGDTLFRSVMRGR